jgi:chromosome segregation ATPase
MNDIISTANTELAIRTPAVIAAEINNIKEQTRKIALYNSIEIGRRLVEAKSLIPFGEWGEWLESSVQYSQRTAENLMRIFEEYGSEQITLLSDNVKSQALAKLSYTQAVALLALPEEERETFVEENDVESMSSRELKKAIDELKKAKEENEFIKEMWEKDRDESQKKIQELEAKLENSGLSDEEKHEYEKKLADEKAYVEEKENELADKDKLIRELKNKNTTELEKSKNELAKLKEKIKELETKPLDVHAGATEEDISKAKAEAAEKYEKELAILKVEKEQAEKRIKELEIKATQQNEAAMKYKVYFEEIVKNFQELLRSLSELKETDPDAYERYKKAVAGLLDKMQERLQ